MNLASLISDTRRCDCHEPLLPCFSLCWISAVVVFSRVTFWSVTNPLTIFKLRSLECHRVESTTICGRDSQGPRLLPSDIHLLGCDDRCVVIVTAIFMDRCSCRLKVRSLRVAAAFFRPIALQLFDKYVMLSLVVALDFSLFFETPFWHQKGRLVFSATAASLIWSSDDTQKDFSWLPLVSSSTNAPTDSMWRSGEICQVLSTKAFTSFCQARDGIMGSSLPRHHCLVPPHVAEDCTNCFSFMCSCLPTRWSSPCFPSSWPGTASFRSCLLLPPGLLNTLEAGFCAGSRACCFSFVFPFALFESRCALCFLTACEECPFKRCGRMKVLLPS